jgi:carboxypeptidase Q
MHKKFRVCRVAALIGLSMSPVLMAQVAVEKVDTAIVDKIKEEGLQRSRVMDSISYLTDVHGPRLTGSPLTKVAGQWTKERLTEWGLENSHLESWGPFGRGWTLEACSVNLVEPHFTALIAHPKAWTPSTTKTIRSEPIYLDASTPEELEKYRGKLGRAIVLISPPREVKALFEPPATRQSDAELLGLANADPSTPRRRPGAGGPGGPGAGGPGAGGPGAGGPAGGPAGGRGGRGDRNASGTPASGEAQPTPAPRGEGRGAGLMVADKWQMAYEEGAAVVIEPGRGDGGTVFVQSATMPRRADPAGREGANPFSRGPRPWATDPPDVVPQLVMAAEHYNRIVRMVQKGAHPKLSIDIESRYHDSDLNSFNVIAEIPGSDLKDEVVMLGGHFDSWHAGTGATDNAIGCGVAMEAMRILKAVDAKPRRTIRIALWTGEEQGLLGSQAYVADHFGSRKGGGGFGGGSGRPTYELKAEHEKFSSYFNLDNGTGKIRGIYLQGNEGVRSIFRAWLAPFADMGATTITSSNTGGTDHQSFDGIGLPGFQFIQDPVEYDTRTHHSSMDVYERIQADDAKQASVIMASFVYHAAMRDEKLPRKQLEGEVVLSPTSPAPAANAPAVSAPVAPAPAAQATGT